MFVVKEIVMRRLAKLRKPRAMCLRVWMAKLKASAGPLEMGCQSHARILGRCEKIIVAKQRMGPRLAASPRHRQASRRAQPTKGLRKLRRVPNCSLRAQVGAFYLPVEE